MDRESNSRPVRLGVRQQARSDRGGAGLMSIIAKQDIVVYQT
jgi:hypothetical protein